MSFLRGLFSGKDKPIQSYDDFWAWFIKNEKNFYDAVKRRNNIKKEFFDRLSDKLGELHDGFLYLAGMTANRTVELIITADGSIKHFVFVEELINAAPTIDGWKFTALKPSMDIKDLSIEMSGYTFDATKLTFYSNHLADYPDEIDITIIHEDLTEENKVTIINGVYIFLDNYLGELDFALTIDNLQVIGKPDPQTEIIPIEKLKDYLSWRQKEFIERYEGIRHNTESDTYAALEAKLENGRALIAVINSDLLQWDSKCSHPWILSIEITYDGDKNNGMPDDNTYQLLNEIENKISEELKDFEGYLNIGRQTADNMREIFLACREFRRPSKVLSNIQKEFNQQIPISYNIYKDKYWQSLDRFNHAV